MSLGTVAKLASSAHGTAGPFFMYLISVVGSSSYTSGGDDLLTPLRAITHDKLDVMAVIPVDSKGVVPAYMKSGPAKESGAGTFALEAGMNLKIRLDDESDLEVKFKSADFASIAAATAAEVVAVINRDLANSGVVASVTNTTHVTLTGDGIALQVMGGSANDILAFATTKASDAGLLKIYWAPSGHSAVLDEASGNLSSLTFKFLVIAR